MCVGVSEGAECVVVGVCVKDCGSAGKRRREREGEREREKEERERHRKRGKEGKNESKCLG